MIAQKLLRKKGVAFILLLGMVPTTAHSAGISVDAGLQPAEDKWIMRTVMMSMRREEDPTPMNREMDRVTLNTVLAYGVRRNLALIIKQPVAYREMKMNGNSSTTSGAGDLLVSAKYGLFRQNTKNYTFGLSGILGLEAPVGTSVFSSDTWDLRPGVYASFRKKAFAWDLNIAYMWNGVADDNAAGIDPGDELSIDAAMAYQYSIGETANMALAPVVEFSFLKIYPDENSNYVANTGESVIYLSPGIKWTVNSLIVEGLVRVPVWQDQRGLQTERGVGFVAGLRFMF